MWALFFCQNGIRGTRDGGTIIFVELVFLKMQKIVKEKQKNREKVLQKSKFCCILWVSHIFFTTQAYGGEQT